MKIHQLLDTPVIVSNEEQEFVKSHGDIIPLSALHGRELWIAQNLVRKNVFKLTKDSKNIVINKGDGNDNSRNSI